MAKYRKKTEQETIPYSELERALKAVPPGRIYLLRGEEDFLRDAYLAQLRKMCVPEGTESFNYRRLNGPKVDMKELSEAVEAMPFMGERTFAEVRDFDINKTSDYDGAAFTALLSDVPEWATVAFVFSPEYQPDGRLGPVKALKKYGLDVVFTPQRADKVSAWIIKHFQQQNKQCSPDVADYLQRLSGNKMNALLPEIIKIAGAVKTPQITREDIDRLATKTPQATVFQMADCIGKRQYEAALGVLAELLSDRDQTAAGILYWISETVRQLYCAKLSPAGPAGREYMLECFPELAARPFVIGKMTELAGSFSLRRLARAVELCADCDFAMRSGGQTDENERLKELILRLAVEEEYV